MAEEDSRHPLLISTEAAHVEVCLLPTCLRFEIKHDALDPERRVRSSAGEK